MAATMRPASEAARQRLDTFVRDGGFFVTTGQQTGLFGGPLYTINKALSAIRLAQALEQELGSVVLPLFWVASTDHDFDEVNHLEILDGQNVLHRLTLEPLPDEPPVSMGRRVLGQRLEPVLDQLAQVLPPSEFVPPLLDLVRRAYTPESTMASAFTELMAGLLAPLDLVLVDPSHPELQRLAVPVLLDEIEHAAENEARLQNQTARLVEAGYHAQVAVGGGALNVAYEDEAGRERLVREDGGFVLRRTKRRFDRDELLQLLESAPERFSPNVLLRPVLESTLFPTIAYVAGPSELSYLAQTGCVFKAHGLEMPVIYPRATITLVERKVAKILEKFGVELNDFRQPVRELAARVLREDMPPELAQALSSLRTAIDDGYDGLLKEAQGVDPTLKGPLTTARNTSQAALRESEKKIMAAVKSQNATTVEQLEKAAINLFPNGVAQERILNILQYLARYGPELLPAMAAAIPVDLRAAAPEWSGVHC